MQILLRWSLCLLLCLAIPLSGMAAVAVQVEPCPMQESGMHGAADATHDCCDEEKSALLGSKICKSGQQCQGAGLLQVTADKAALAAFRTPRLFAYSDFIPSLSPDDLWRPPRA
ncbi:hypothetical protein [Pseudomonas sp. MBLB4136]|uniref:hypothetical protein n=1 Tax=Pseudomonas sp. MBLB4136 TaxID=3451558 RepID=UPI003F74E6A8